MNLPTNNLVGDAMGESSENAPIPTTKKFSNVQPVWHLILLSLITIGLYFYFWSYRNWKQMNDYKKLNINPTEKTLILLIPLIGIIFVWEQFIAFRDLSKEVGTRISFDPSLMFLGFIIFNIMWRLPDPYLLLGFLSVVPLAFVQRSINSAWAEAEPGLPARKLPTTWDLLAVIVSWNAIVSLNTLISYIFR